MISVSDIGHHRRADLTEADSVTPARSPQPESPRIALRVFVEGRYHKCRTVQVRPRQRPSYLELFSYDEPSMLADNSQPNDPTRRSTFESFQCANAAEAPLRPLEKYLLQLIVRVFDLPPVEVPRLLIKAWE